MVAQGEWFEATINGQLTDIQVQAGETAS